MPEFQIRPTYELDVKTIALEDDKPELGVFVKIVPKWSITAMLSDLVASRVDLHGLFVCADTSRKANGGSLAAATGWKMAWSIFRSTTRAQIALPRTTSCWSARAAGS